VPRVVEQLKADIDPASINALTDDDLAIWKTPEGQTYVDGRLDVMKCVICVFMRY
jgi:hypothetical protein